MIRIFSVLILMFCLASAAAQEFTKTANHVTLVVSNFEDSKAFYTELLGLEEIETPWLPAKQMFLAIGESFELHMGEVPGVEIKPNDFNHIAISVDDFDGFLAHLKSAGVVYTRLGGGEDFFVSTRPDEVRQTWIADPDGYWIEINDVK